MIMSFFARSSMALALVLVGCVSAPSVEIADDVDFPEVDQIATAGNELGWDIYRQVAKEKSGNLLLSPYSLASALAMAYAGAAGETATVMGKTLHLPDGAPKSLFPKLMKWVGLFAKAGNDQYSLNSANAAWVSDAVTLQPDYQAILEKFPNGVKRIDFRQSNQARLKINQWVENQTHGKITDLIPDGAITAATRLTLVNALYLKAAWAHPFNKRATYQGPFFTSESQSVTTSLMKQQEHYPYYHFHSGDAVELPYLMGVDNDISLVMRIYLPHKVDGLKDLEQELIENGAIASLPQQWPQTKVDLTLPKFKIESEVQLTQPLKDLGMAIPFIPGRADFSGIDGMRDLFIDQVIQKTVIEVDEAGTEAAAATAVVMAMAMAPRPETPVEFKADHPFIFTLVDAKTGTVLFMGKYVDGK